MELLNGWCKHCKERFVSLLLVAASNDAGGRGSKATFCHASEDHEHEFTFPDTQPKEAEKSKEAA